MDRAPVVVGTPRPLKKRVPDPSRSRPWDPRNQGSRPPASWHGFGEADKDGEDLEVALPPAQSVNDPARALPLVATTMATFGHAFHRAFRYCDQYAEPMAPNSSVVTGCHSSPGIGRASVDGPVIAAEQAVLAARQLDSEVEQLTSQVHIDDLSHESAGSEAGVAKTLAVAGHAFGTAIQAAGFKISAKSVVISSSKRVAKQLQMFFRKHLGAAIKIHHSGEHLGHNRTNAAGKYLYTPLRKRFEKAAVRNRRVTFLAKLKTMPTS